MEQAKSSYGFVLGHSCCKELCQEAKRVFLTSSDISLSECVCVFLEEKRHLQLSNLRQFFSRKLKYLKTLRKRRSNAVDFTLAEIIAPIPLVLFLSPRIYTSLFLCYLSTLVVHSVSLIKYLGAYEKNGLINRRSCKTLFYVS
jgi:hypothetical protein